MTKRAISASFGKTLPAGLGLLAAALALSMAGSAQAQQAYYYPQAAGSGPVSVNYGALTPYGAPGYGAAVPGGFQPYGAAPSARITSAPKSVFTPSAPAYAVPSPAYGGAPVYGYAATPSSAPFVAPYANPAFAPGFASNAAGLPKSTPTSNLQSYLNTPGGQPVTLMAPGDTTTKKSKKKKKKAVEPMPASTPTATEEGAAAQVAAAEAALESGPAPEPTAPVVAAAAEPLPEPTPPAEPTEVPASVPSPVENAPAAAASVAAAAPAAEAPAAEAPAADAPAADAAATETPAAEAAPAEQVASAEAPADTAPDTSGAAMLPAGATRIVFDGTTDDLPQGATGDLDAIATKMLGDEAIKVQVLAYSSGTADTESQARRKALARGLEVRKYLIGKGVRSNRIDVRALGTKSEGSPADRVDIVPAAG